MATATVPPGNNIETAHEDMIHDAQLDYYGKRLATCSSDRTVRVFAVENGQAKGEGTVLRGHSGPVWQVAWAHPSFGSILASCSYDSRVYVWKEISSSSSSSSTFPSNPVPPNNSRSNNNNPKSTSGGGPGEWETIKQHLLHTASVNSIAWAPYELGPILACASSDGKVSVLGFNNDGSSTYEIFPAHEIGVNAISWSPATTPGSLLTAGQPGQAGAQGQGLTYQKKFASAGCDNVVRIWSYKNADDKETKPEMEEELHGHTDWVRDVAWAPNIGLPGEHIATASQDRTVLIHYRPTPTSPWKSTPLIPPSSTNDDPKFPDAVWKVSWSLAGNILAVSCADGKVSLWKEVIGGKGWECINEMTS